MERGESRYLDLCRPKTRLLLCSSFRVDDLAGFLEGDEAALADVAATIVRTRTFFLPRYTNMEAHTFPKCQDDRAK
jgi:hypothetical protein